MVKGRPGRRPARLPGPGRPRRGLDPAGRRRGTSSTLRPMACTAARSGRTSATRAPAAVSTAPRDQDWPVAARAEPPAGSS